MRLPCHHGRRRSGVEPTKKPLIPAFVSIGIDLKELKNSLRSATDMQSAKKLVVIGDKGVGKTSLIRKALEQDFEADYRPTTTPDFFSMKVDDKNYEEITGQLWDIGGSCSIGKSFLRGTHGVVLVVDISDANFLSGLDEIYDNFAKLAGFEDTSFPCLVVGNKKDLVSERECSKADAELASWCMKRRKSSSIVFRTVSSKASGPHDNDAFEAFSAILKLSVEMGSIMLKANAGPRSTSEPPFTRSPIGGASTLAPSENASDREVFDGGKDAEEEEMGVIEAKVVLAGAPAVGKTSILRRFADNDVINESKLGKYDPTIGADFRLLQIPVRDKMLRMQVWDTAGDRKMISLGRSIYRNADYLILVYDITDRESFQILDVYYDNFVMYGNAEDPDAFPCLLVGNKCDVGDRATDLEEVLKWCGQKRPNRPITHIECSALRGIAVNDVFIIVADAIAAYEAYLDGEGSDSDSEENRYAHLEHVDEGAISNKAQDISRTKVTREGRPAENKSCLVDFAEGLCVLQ